MIRAGFEDTDPRTGTRSVLVKGAEEMAGRGWVVEVHCPEGAPPANSGRGDMVYRQTTDFGETTPAAVGEVLGAFHE